jgi:hypothetical protein
MDMVDGFGKVDIVRWSLGPEWVLIITVFEQQVWLTHLHGSLSLSPKIDEGMSTLFAMELHVATILFATGTFMCPSFFFYLLPCKHLRGERDTNAHSGAIF